MGMAADLPNEQGRFTVVVLTQMHAALPRGFRHVFATALEPLFKTLALGLFALNYFNPRHAQHALA